MDGNRKTEQNQEVINFNQMILAVWKGKWIVLGFAITFGLIAFLISSFLIPDRYRAAAVISVPVRSTWIELIEKGTSQMARSDEILELTRSELGIVDIEQQGNLEFTAFMEYWGQLELEVSADDPELAARAANLWAELVYERIFIMLGANQELLNMLEEQVALAGTKWASAELELTEYLLESHLELYPVEISAAEASLLAYREVINRNQIAISDAITLEGQIEAINPSDSLPSGIILSDNNLLGRAAASIEEPQLNFQPEETLDLDLPPAEALVFLQQLRAALESQNEQILRNTAGLEERILSLASSLEIEQAQVESLTLKRDLARAAFEEYTDQFIVLRKTKNNLDQIVKISTRAVPPTEVSNPDSLATAGFAGISSALLTMLILLFIRRRAVQGVTESDR